MANCLLQFVLLLAFAPATVGGHGFRSLHGCKHEPTKKHVVLEWSVADSSVFDTVHELWLLDNRPDWKHSSGQKMRHVDVDSVATLMSVHCNNSGLTATWQSETACDGTSDNCNKHDKVFFPVEFLARWASGSEATPSHRQSVALNQATFAGLKSHNFFDVMNSDGGLLAFMHDVYEHGVGFVHDSPTNLEILQKVSARMGGVMSTLYGKQWSMKSKVTTGPKNNIAYSSLQLPLHQDLVYYESPPGLQLLHCISFDERIVGGESTLMDIFHVAEVLRREAPAAFKTLVEIPVTFQKGDMQREAPAQYEYRKPHIVVHPTSGDIIEVTWSPPFEGPLRIASSRVEEYYDARKIFEETLANVSKTHLLEYRMKDGMLVAFNNRRILHGRNGFSEFPGSERHFEGVYINIDEFLNRLQVMQKLVTGDNSASHDMMHVGNRNF